jgi:hypothetical protein
MALATAAMVKRPAFEPLVGQLPAEASESPLHRQLVDQSTADRFAFRETLADLGFVQPH